MTLGEKLCRTYGLTSFKRGGCSLALLAINEALEMRRGRKIAKVAMARKLAVGLYWMWRKGWNYEQLTKFGSHAGQPGNRHGVQQIASVDTDTAAAQIADREESRVVASNIRSLKWAGDKRIQNEVDAKSENRALTA